MTEYGQYFEDWPMGEKPVLVSTFRRAGFSEYSRLSI